MVPAIVLVAQVFCAMTSTRWTSPPATVQKAHAASKTAADVRLQTPEFAVIAPSVSTSMEARRVMARLRAKEVPLRGAAAVLVVVRSALYDPLQYSYESICNLKEDADNQLNIAGSNFHVYIFSIDDDLRAARVGHQTYTAN
jgi:hypothetical protein